MLTFAVHHLKRTANPLPIGRGFVFRFMLLKRKMRQIEVLELFPGWKKKRHEAFPVSSWKEP